MGSSPTPGTTVKNDVQALGRHRQWHEGRWEDHPKMAPRVPTPRQATGAPSTNTTVSWKHWPCPFPQHGPGRKHERHLGITDWPWRVIEEHPADFLRGLFHSDGARVHNWATRVVAGEKKRYEYPRWHFVNALEEIPGCCGDALDLLHIAW